MLKIIWKKRGYNYIVLPNIKLIKKRGGDKTILKK